MKTAGRPRMPPLLAGCSWHATILTKRARVVWLSRTGGCGARSLERTCRSRACLSGSGWR